MGKDLNGKEVGEGVYQLKSGRFCARVHGFGRRVCKTFDSPIEARLWVASMQMRDSPTPFNSVMTLDEWFEYWLKNIKRPVIKLGTYQTYEDIYRNHIKPWIGHMKLEDIKPLDYQRVILEQIPDYKSSTLNIIKQLLSQIFKSALENEIISKSPERSIVIKGGDEKETKVLTVDEQKRFTEDVNKGFRFRDECLLVLETGLRKGEVLGLKKSDIDLEHKKLYVNRSMNYDKKEKRYIEDTPKSRAGTRTVPLTDKACEILRNRELKGEYYFLDIGRRSIVDFDYHIIRVCNRLKIDHVSIHGLRHTFATRCIECGIPPKVLQRIMGHSSVSITMDLYVHVTDDILGKEIQKLNSI